MDLKRVSSPRDSPTFRAQVHNLTDGDLEQQTARYNYSHFHAPFNNNNRYMSSIDDNSKLFLRDCNRYDPYASGCSTTPQYQRAAIEQQRTCAHHASYQHLNLISNAQIHPLRSMIAPTPAAYSVYQPETC